MIPHDHDIHCKACEEIANRAEPKRDAWEYTNIEWEEPTGEAEMKIEQYGKDGWEMIAVTQVFVHGISKFLTTLWFKRKL